jgi:hypothetical protein
MLRMLAASWLTGRLARPLSRAIPNPLLRTAAIAGAGMFASRLLRKRSNDGGRRMKGRA